MQELDRKEFWNARAGLGARSGTNDTGAKQIEVETILNAIPAGSRVVDFGCGAGETLVRLAVDKDCSGVGMDYADAMLQTARKAALGCGVGNMLDFVFGQLPEVGIPGGKFDYALTERALINLDTPEAQFNAIESILSHVRPGGRYLMIENSQQGLEQVNYWRERLGLSRIESPWHNLYLDEQCIPLWEKQLDGKAKLVSVSSPTSTYYLCSRVVVAKLAQDAGEEPRYDH